MQIPLYIILLTQNAVSSKIAFLGSHLHLELSQNLLQQLLRFHIQKSDFEHIKRHSLMYEINVKLQC